MVTPISTLFSAMEWRCVGPHRGGRVVAVAGDPTDPMVFYFGACAGGLWKTDDGGTYWRNVSDGYFKTSAVGAVAVSDSDHNVIYVGMGETCMRGNVSHGDGVYRSTDGGETWAHLGLEDTRHISRIRVHPQNPDLVYVAAFGHAFGVNQERGVFRSKDGGKNWENILFKSEKAGAIDLSMDPKNPRVLYAAIYEARRYPWTNVSGGPDSGLYRSMDGGDTWEDVTEKKGMPQGIKGRIGVAVSPARSGRVWAIVEADEGGLYRSDDRGENWEKLSDDAEITGRPWYYCHVFADTQDPETVYVLEGGCYKSVDGGRSFTSMQIPHPDNHDLWIDPRDSRRMIEGNDGGACVSFNEGASWSTIYNQPTAQFYHITTDNRHPYRLYGAQQDNSTISVPSESHRGSISQGDWYIIGGGECGYIAVRPDDPDIVYAGSHSNGILTRYDHRASQTRHIMVWPEEMASWGAKDMKYRFQWTYPIVLSPFDPNVLYVTGNKVFRSTDEGSSWEAISPDLTRDDDTKLGMSGGPINQDGTNAEYYCTIFAFAESPRQRGVLWAGSDDGLVHVSRDNGMTWENVTPEDLPEWSMISIIDPSCHEPGAAYVAATRYKLDDTLPYLFKTNDYGKSWVKITKGIPDNDFTRVIREDPGRRGLLYAGTETGIYVSLDDGDNWHSLQLNLPVVPIYDLVIKNNDLIAATHGRSFWILDDVTPLHQIDYEVSQSVIKVFKPRDFYRHAPPERFGAPSIAERGYERTGPLVVAFNQRQLPDGQIIRTYRDGGKNPPDGVVVTYYLKEKPKGPITLTFLTEHGDVIKSFKSKGFGNLTPDAETTELCASAMVGVNRFVWDTRHPGALGLTGDPTTEKLYNPALTGPMALPGRYQVQLEVGGEISTESFTILKDPRVTATEDELELQFALLVQIRDKLSETHRAVRRIRSIRQQLQEWVYRVDAEKPSGQVAVVATCIQENLAAIEGELVQVHARAQVDRLKFPGKLNGKLDGLLNWVASADDKPTMQSYDVFDYLSVQVDTQLSRLTDIVETDLEKFNSLVSELEVPPVVSKNV